MTKLHFRIAIICLLASFVTVAQENTQWCGTVGHHQHIILQRLTQNKASPSTKACFSKEYSVCTCKISSAC